MKHLYTTCLALLVITSGLLAQTEDFEAFGVTDGNPLNQAANGVAFEGNNVLLYNNYNADWDAINNSTYAYLSMLDGDSFSKKFGGVTGNDPDYFLLTIKGYLNGELLPDTLNHYLADFRFEDNTLDYIQSEWTILDIMGTIGGADVLTFELSSTDVGEFGMNTPAYFCMDDVSITLSGNTAELSTSLDIKVGPNPTTDYVTLTAQQPLEAVTLYDIQGNVRYRSEADRSTQTIDLSQYASGIYTILVSYEGTDYLQQIIKL